MTHTPNSSSPNATRTSDAEVLPKKSSLSQKLIILGILLGFIFALGAGANSIAGLIGLFNGTALYILIGILSPVSVIANTYMVKLCIPEFLHHLYEVGVRTLFQDSMGKYYDVGFCILLGGAFILTFGCLGIFRQRDNPREWLPPARIALLATCFAFMLGFAVALGGGLTYTSIAALIAFSGPAAPYVAAFIAIVSLLAMFTANIMGVVNALQEKDLKQFLREKYNELFGNRTLLTKMIIIAFLVLSLFGQFKCLQCAAIGLDNLFRLLFKHSQMLASIIIARVVSQIAQLPFTIANIFKTVNRLFAGSWKMIRHHIFKWKNVAFLGNAIASGFAAAAGAPAIDTQLKIGIAGASINAFCGPFGNTEESNDPASISSPASIPPYHTLTTSEENSDGSGATATPASTDNSAEADDGLGFIPHSLPEETHSLFPPVSPRAPGTSDENLVKVSAHTLKFTFFKPCPYKQPTLIECNNVAAPCA